MTHHRVLMSLCVGLICALSCGAEAGHPYLAPDGAYRVQLPSQPIVETRGAQLIVKTATDSERSTYFIRREPVPESYATDESPDRLYDEFQRGGVAALAGSLQSQRALVSRGQARPGREFVVHAETKRTGEPYEMTARLFRSGRHLYSVTSTTPRDIGARRRATTVLDSFEFLR